MRITRAKETSQFILCSISFPLLIDFTPPVQFKYRKETSVAVPRTMPSTAKEGGGKATAARGRTSSTAGKPSRSRSVSNTEKKAGTEKKPRARSTSAAAKKKKNGKGKPAGKKTARTTSSNGTTDGASAKKKRARSGSDAGKTGGPTAKKQRSTASRSKARTDPNPTPLPPVLSVGTASSEEESAPEYVSGDDSGNDTENAAVHHDDQSAVSTPRHGDASESEEGSVESDVGSNIESDVESMGDSKEEGVTGKAAPTPPPVNDIVGDEDDDEDMGMMSEDDMDDQGSIDLDDTRQVSWKVSPAIFEQLKNFSKQYGKGTSLNIVLLKPILRGSSVLNQILYKVGDNTTNNISILSYVTHTLEYNPDEVDFDADFEDTENDNPRVTSVSLSQLLKAHRTLSQDVDHYELIRTPTRLYIRAEGVSEQEEIPHCGAVEEGQLDWVNNVDDIPNTVKLVLLDTDKLIRKTENSVYITIIHDTFTCKLNGEVVHGIRETIVNESNDQSSGSTKNYFVRENGVYRTLNSIPRRRVMKETAVFKCKFSSDTLRRCLVRISKPITTCKMFLLESGGCILTYNQKPLLEYVTDDMALVCMLPCIADDEN